MGCEFTREVGVVEKICRIWIEVSGVVSLLLPITHHCFSIKSHFGSDTAGLNTTRRYLCEALSFQYRYVPIGLLERLPARLNDRAPAFNGRDELGRVFTFFSLFPFLFLVLSVDFLETLLASPDSKDWMKISEMFLGPAPEMWSFTPKHKSNSNDANDDIGNDLVGQG